MMKAAVLVAPQRFALRDVPMPAIGPEDALIRVRRTGICGTDLHIFNGHYAADRLPLIPGHEFCGEVAAYGAQVRHLLDAGGGRYQYRLRHLFLVPPQRGSELSGDDAGRHRS